MSLRCGVVVRPWSVDGSPAIPCRTGFPSMVAFNHPQHRLVGSDHLRIQLDQLRAEAEITRSKANNARLRLMRLTEAAENLQRRAAKSIQIGKENEARELLIQKKKLLHALEKSKNRIEVLDKLSAKVTEAISLKETQLIGQVAIPPLDNQLNSHQQIHFISPNEETYEKSSSGSSETLLKHMFEQIDLKLCSVEADIENFLSAQTEENKEVQVNAKLEKLCEILKDVLSIREKKTVLPNITENKFIFKIDVGASAGKHIDSLVDKYTQRDRESSAHEYHSECPQESVVLDRKEAFDPASA